MTHILKVSEPTEYKMKRRVTITHFFKPKRLKENESESNTGNSYSTRNETESVPCGQDGGTGAENDGGQVSVSESQPPSDEKKETDQKKYVHTFQSKWLKDYLWLEHEENSGKMFCKSCISAGKKNTFTDGCNNYRTSTLVRHMASYDHKQALKDDLQKNYFVAATNNAISQKTDSVIHAMRCAYWLAKEGVATLKFSSLLNLCKLQGSESLLNLDTGKNATYTSSQSAEEMQESIAEVINNEIMLSLQGGFTSFLIDESTDITVTKKLVIYGRTVDENTFDQKTYFLGNVALEESSVTAKVIFDKLVEFIHTKGLSLDKTYAFGSDGASIMTGRKNGVAARIKEKNPFAINVHCFAHRLALCTSKAAESTEYIHKTFQAVMSDMFYYFKRSADRVANLTHMQKVLECEEMKLKEVHEIRWFAFFNALKAVYLSWKPLVMYFKGIKKPSDKEKHFLKTLTDVRFIHTMYMLMDVVPAFTQLNIVFQKQNLDISAVHAVLEATLDCAKKALSGTTYYQAELKDKLQKKDNKVHFKGIQLESESLASAMEDFIKVRTDFITKLQDNVNKRFPKESTEIVFSFKCLGMRAISFMSQSELENYGNSDIEVLMKFYGEEKKAADGSVKLPLIDPVACRNEWSALKKLVLDQRYPRDSLPELWKVIKQYHSEMFPNMLILGKLALLTPLQTADCERGFSCQNNIHTAGRNRLKASTLQRLMTIMIEGPPIEQFDFRKAVQVWSSKAQRRILH